MELWQLNIFVVLVIAIFTKKDMAIIAGAIMVLGWVVTLNDYSQIEQALMFCGLNSLLAIFASAYNHIKRCNLSIVTASLAAIATSTNLIQMYDQTVISSTITAILGWSLALALLLMDGDKGLIGGFLGDCRATFGRIVYILGHNNNNKGAN